MNNMYDFFAGIDLGTTNSAIAILEEDGSKLNTPVIPIDRRVDFRKGRKSSKSDKTLPSAVMYCPDEQGGYDVLVGDCAREGYKYRPYAVAMSVKERMGQSQLTYPGWDKGFPDQTPHAVSAQILRTLLDGMENAYGERPTEAVITVPANYSVMKRNATLRAAELAGLNVRDAAGAYRDNILLSEPEAVIYHVLNQKQNGDMGLLCDFDKPQCIMVYDMGGGTLDITTHMVRRSADNPDCYEMKLVATNRYSDMAGNTIDRTLARYMYRNYMEELRQSQPELYRKAQEVEGQDMAYFERMAEELKISFNDRIANWKKRGNQLSKDHAEPYGSVLSGGRSVESSMTLREMEECLAPFLGLAYDREDYKRVDALPEERNMLYPVLQVMNRAAKKLGVSDLKVDMVILNGGMSRMYLVRDRLTQFFGFPMTVVSDPDTSVAQGAAVYHYYSKKQSGTAMASQFQEERTTLQPAAPAGFRDVTLGRQIHSLGRVLNESIYLGTAGGYNELLAEAGVDLPYRREDLPAFYLSAGVSHIEIPLRECHDGRFVTIGRGRITFGRTCTRRCPVAVRISITQSGLLTLEADSDLGCGQVEIMLGEAQNTFKRRRGKALNPPKGAALLPDNELSRMNSLVRQVDEITRSRRYKPQQKAKQLEEIRQCKENMLRCGNPQNFAEPMLKLLKQTGSDALRWNLFPVARSMCPFWTEEQKRRLSAVCVASLETELNGFGISSFRTNPNIEAIKTVGVCGVEKDCLRLEKLQDLKRYQSALLFAWGVQRTHREWIFRVLREQWGRGESVQDALHGLYASVYSCEENETVEGADEMAVYLLRLVNSGQLRPGELTLALGAVGWLCSQVGEDRCSEAKQVLDGLNLCYPGTELECAGKAICACRALLYGEELSGENEQFLLSLVGGCA